MKIRRSGLGEGDETYAALANLQSFDSSITALNQIPNARTEQDNINYAAWESAHPEQVATFGRWQRLISRRAQEWTPSTYAMPPLLPSLDIDGYGSRNFPAMGNWNWGNGLHIPSLRQFFEQFGLSVETGRDMLSSAGFNPWAEYQTVRSQRQDPGSTPNDFVWGLYRRVYNGWGLVLDQRKSESSSWVWWREGIGKPALMVIAIMGGQAYLASAIGTAVMGSYAVTYPALASAIGNVAIATVANGGDVGAAVESAVLTYVGGAAGGYVTTATDSATIGTLTASVARAAMTGGNLEQAAALSLIQSGARSVDQFFSQPEETAMFETDSNFADSFSPSGFDFGGGNLVEFGDADSYAPDYFSGGNSMMNFLSPSALPDETSGFGGGENYDHEGGHNYVNVGNPFSDVGLVDIGGQIPVYTDIPPVYGTVPAASAGGGSTWVSDLTGLALAAIRVNAAYQQSQAPIRTVTTTPSGHVSSPNPDGTLTMRDASGRLLGNTRPNPGTPYVLPDGRTIINNGNGTYSLINSSGVTQTIPYAATPASAGGSNNTMLLLGAGAVALLAFS